jgi:hypothetical protein
LLGCRALPWKRVDVGRGTPISRFVVAKVRFHFEDWPRVVVVVVMTLMLR